MKAQELLKATAMKNQHRKDSAKNKMKFHSMGFTTSNFDSININNIKNQKNNPDQTEWTSTDCHGVPHPLSKKPSIVKTQDCQGPISVRVCAYILIFVTNIINPI